MTYTELIQNARECAQDAILWLDIAEKLTDLTQRQNACASAYGNLKTGAEEASRARDEAGVNFKSS